MKQVSPFLTAGIILFFLSCGSGNEKEENKTADTTAAVTDTMAPAKPTFTPFKMLLIREHVKNFEKWKPVYLAYDSLRQAYGISPYGLGRGIDDSNIVYVANKMNDLQKAKEFSASAGLKVAMQKAGVTGAPSINYIDVIRNDETPLDQKERVMVAHHVKDFDAWLKVYDAEGKDARAANGLIGRGLGRGAEDSNMVYIVFAITDMAKAKARIASLELKKLMTDAGVDSAPVFYYYKLVE